MHFQLVSILLLLEYALAAPQIGSSKGTPKGTPKGSTTPKASGGGLGAMAQMMGFNPNDEITSMVCQTFDGKNAMGSVIGGMFGSPNGVGPDEQCQVDRSGGSGPYKANFTDDASLPGHTIYAPITPPEGQLPVIVWGNGFCLAAGTMFANFLNEIASHGFLIVANGARTPGIGTQTTYKDLITSLDWLSTPAAQKYGKLDLSKIAVAGQSCGGLEAYQASTDPRIKLTALFNSGVIAGNSQKQMTAFTHPVAYFLGGAKDIAQKNGATDYGYLKVPALLASAEIGHIGTYYQKYGGKMGKAAVAFFKWQQKGDAASKAVFCSPGADSTLVKAGFKIQSKNGMC